jgi:hypothetical protein
MFKFVTRPRVIGVVAASLLTAAAFGAGFALADQPHMEAAKGLLEQARSELNAAEANKGGHRLKAIADIDAAIAEVRAGMAAAN